MYMAEKNRQSIDSKQIGWNVSRTYFGYVFHHSNKNNRESNKGNNIFIVRCWRDNPCTGPYQLKLANKTSHPAISIKQNRFDPTHAQHLEKSLWIFRGGVRGAAGEERKREKLRVFISAP